VKKLVRKNFARKKGEKNRRGGMYRGLTRGSRRGLQGDGSKTKLPEGACNQRSGGKTLRTQKKKNKTMKTNRGKYIHWNLRQPNLRHNKDLTLGRK